MRNKIFTHSLFIVLGGLFLAFGPLTSNQAMACPAPSPQYQFSVPCTDIKTVSEFTGAADQLVGDITDDISESGDNIVNALEDSSSAQINVINDSAQSIIETLTTLNAADSSDTMTRKKLMHEAKMDYMLELQSREIQARNNPMGMNDTTEELNYIIGILEDSKEVPVPITIETVKTEIDSQEPEIPVKIRSAEGVCDDDPEACTVLQKITPGETMERYFYECSREKREIALSVSKERFKSSVNNNVREKQSESVRVQNTSQSNANKLIEQNEIACSPEQYSAGVCNFDMEQEEYVKAIRNNEIIVNGNISSSNFYSPSSIGSVGSNSESQITPEQREILRRQNLIFDGTENENTPPLIYTYKNSNQYLSALDFSDNLINETLIANQSIEEQGDLNNSEFQSMYLNRMAGLSLSRFSLSSNISDRLGQNVAEELSTNGLDRENPVKERANGAGNLDQLIYKVESSYAELSELDAANTKNVMLKMLDAQNIQNQLLLDEILRTERIELLMASILANKYNSPEYTEYLNDVRGN